MAFHHFLKTPSMMKHTLDGGFVTSGFPCNLYQSPELRMRRGALAGSKLMGYIRTGTDACECNIFYA